MAKARITTPVDTSTGTAAYALAVLHATDVQPRLPAGTLTTLAADLTLLGAAPTPVSTPTSAPTPAPTPAPAPVPAAPSLVEATATAVALITGIHAAIQGAKAPLAVRKVYGASGTATRSPKAVVVEGHKILTQAQADPAQALSLGILPADTTALGEALAALTAAETLAKSTGSSTGLTAKERRAAGSRMNEAVARIAGAGALAFATNATVRAQFEALTPKKTKKA